MRRPMRKIAFLVAAVSLLAGSPFVPGGLAYPEEEEIVLAPFGSAWRYQTDVPWTDDYIKAEYDDSTWPVGPAPFGGGCGAVTSWNQEFVFLRRSLVLPEGAHDLHLVYQQRGGADFQGMVFLNGKQYGLPVWTSSAPCPTHPSKSGNLDSSARPGENILVVALGADPARAPPYLDLEVRVTVPKGALRQCMGAECLDVLYLEKVSDLVVAPALVDQGRTVVVERGRLTIQLNPEDFVTLDFVWASADGMPPSDALNQQVGERRVSYQGHGSLVYVERGVQDAPPIAELWDARVRYTSDGERKADIGVRVIRATGIGD